MSDDVIHGAELHAGRAVAWLRAARGLTQEELARAAGTNRRQIQRWETKPDLDVLTLARLVRLLRTDIVFALRLASTPFYRDHRAPQPTKGLRLTPHPYLSEQWCDAFGLPGPTWFLGLEPGARMTSALKGKDEDNG